MAIYFEDNHVPTIGEMLAAIGLSEDNDLVAWITPENDYDDELFTEDGIPLPPPDPEYARWREGCAAIAEGLLAATREREIVWRGTREESSRPTYCGEWDGVIVEVEKGQQHVRLRLYHPGCGGPVCIESDKVAPTASWADPYLYGEKRNPAYMVANRRLIAVANELLTAVEQVATAEEGLGFEKLVAKAGERADPVVEPIEGEMEW